MITTAYRITKERFQDSAFSGEGARIGGGRFNSVGVPAIYAASSLPLALLEVLAGLNRYRRLKPYVYFEVSFEDRHVTAFDHSRLPARWADTPAPEAVRALGDEWLQAARSLILQVPSAVLPQECNYCCVNREPFAFGSHFGRCLFPLIYHHAISCRTRNTALSFPKMTARICSNASVAGSARQQSRRAFASC